LTKFSISFAGVDPVAVLGPADENLTIIGKTFRSQITARGDRIRVSARDDEYSKLRELLIRLVSKAKDGARITPEMVQSEIGRQKETSAPARTVRTATRTEAGPRGEPGEDSISTPRLVVHPKTQHQREYVQAIDAYDVVIAIGPAGTGKTYLAVAKAVSALVNGKVARIVLTRPAVEAGESLGFLPGGFREKVDPYLRPLYDAIYDMIPVERMKRLVDEQVIEVAPLAYMRGRTLSDSFVILDEAQNTTSAQMKMFLTRLGWNSKAVVTGDITQIDLDRRHSSGLIEAQHRLRSIPAIRICYMDKSDVVRPPIVAEIIRAYEDEPPKEEATPSV
jgi:phosphate starvation-inducible PhoH-like protein